MNMVQAPMRTPVNTRSILLIFTSTYQAGYPYGDSPRTPTAQNLSVHCQELRLVILPERDGPDGRHLREHPAFARVSHRKRARVVDHQKAYGHAARFPEGHGGDPVPQDYKFPLEDALLQESPQQ